MTFEEKYGDLLTEMGALEKKLKTREAFLRQRTDYDVFCTDVIMESEPKYYEDLTENPLGMKVPSIGNLEYFKVFQEVLTSYDNRENGNFIHMIRMLCKMRNRTYMEQENLAKSSGGISYSMLQNSPVKLGKLIREYARLNEKIPDEEQEQAKERLKSELQRQKIEIEDFESYYNLCRAAMSLDAPVGEEDADGMNQYEKQQDDKANVEELVLGGNSAYLEKILEKWNDIVAVFRKQGQEYIQVFLTNAMLGELKLDMNRHPYLQEPAGNPEIYQELLPYEETLCESVFHKKYLYSAFDSTIYQKMPEKLYEVYCWLLRKGFSFRDTGIAEVMGDSKSTISKRRKQYEEKVVPEMMKICNYR